MGGFDLGSCIRPMANPRDSKASVAAVLSYRVRPVPATVETITLRARRVAPATDFAVPVLNDSDLYRHSQARFFGRVLAFGDETLLLRAFSLRPYKVEEPIPGLARLDREETSMLVNRLQIGERKFWIHGWYRRDLREYLETHCTNETDS